MEKKQRLLKQFRYISVAEGISFLLLLFIAMPLKYWAGQDSWVKYTGWIHGILFIAYFISCLRVALVCRWSAWRTIMALVASLLPFGPFVFERSVRKEEKLLTGA